jgi:phosphatidylglycerophosphate synthase
LALDLSYPLTRYLYRPLSRPLASVLSSTWVTPIQLTWLGAGLTLLGGAAFAFDAYILGTVLALVGQIVDCADGDLARMTARSSPRGAFLDSVLDRWTDAALIIGLGLSDEDRYGRAALLALAGAMLVSYTRARAQSLGTDCPEGVATRDARLLIIMVAAATGFISQGLLLVAGLGAITSVTRAATTMRSLAAKNER